jgi:hypothetical protein
MTSFKVVDYFIRELTKWNVLFMTKNTPLTSRPKNGTGSLERGIGTVIIYI